MENKQFCELLLLDRSSLRNFRRSLRRSDQAVFDDLFMRIGDHAAAIRISVHGARFETILLAMLLEEHKEVVRLRRLLEEYLNFGTRQ